MRFVLMVVVAIALLVVANEDYQRVSEEAKYRIDYMMEVEANNTGKFHQKLYELRQKLHECQETKNMEYTDFE
jgi:hypothetical protein